MHLRPDIPLRNPKILTDAFATIASDKNLHSLRSAHEVAESPFKWFLKDENNLFEGIQKEFTTEIVNRPRQEFRDAFNPNGYVDVLKSSAVLNSENLHGSLMYEFETPSVIEIDTESEFDYLEYQLERKGSPLTEYLQNLK